MKPLYWSRVSISCLIIFLHFFEIFRWRIQRLAHLILYFQWSHPFYYRSMLMNKAVSRVKEYKSKTTYLETEWKISCFLTFNHFSISYFAAIPLQTEQNLKFKKWNCESQIYVRTWYVLLIHSGTVKCSRALTIQCIYRRHSKGMMVSMFSKLNHNWVNSPLCYSQCDILVCLTLVIGVVLQIYMIVFILFE